MRVLVTGGGTGGHIMPALAIASSLKEQDPTTEFLFVGATGRMETELVPKAGFPLKTVTVKGFSRRKSLSGLTHNVSAVYHAITAGFSCKKILKEFQPDVAVGTGGYVCGPILRQAGKMGIPIVLHESNSFPGVTTKMLSKVAHTVCVATKEAAERIPEGANIEITGNPVRPEFLSYTKEQARNELGIGNKLLIFSVGGSLGAAKLNEIFSTIIEKTSKAEDLYHIHSAGKLEYEEFCAKMEQKQIPLQGEHVDIRPFVDDMARVMAAADLVIARSGAMTVTEILASGCPAILIPSPNVAENHQYYNAMSLVNEGAALCIEEKDLTADGLWEEMKTLIEDDEKRFTMHTCAKKAAILDATDRIVQIIKKAATQRGE